MADVIRKATNKFTKGLVMDFSPENTRNEVLTHALNATLLTFNGNELSLQNDMGNARVETAYLPEGYMPVGTCEYGGVIYVVSYNPLEDKSQIGCFPSPERNVSRHELGEAENEAITNDNFQGTGGQIKNTTQYVLLKNDKLNPGDKFLICANKQIYDEKLENLLVREQLEGEPTDFDFVSNPILALNIVSIEDSGKIVYLNNDVRTYNSTNSYTDPEGNAHTNEYKYHIVGEAAVADGKLNQEAIDIDSYRNVLSSGYSVFKSKTSGKLAILAELIMIDSYNVTHSLVPKKNSYGHVVEGAFDIVIHTEITPEVTGANYNTVPKLQYYYLQKSQGLLSVFDDKHETQIPLYKQNPNNNEYDINDEFTKVKMQDVYVQTVENKYFNGEIDGTSVYKSGKFNFPRPDTYHGRMVAYGGELNEGSGTTNIYTKFTEGKYHRIRKQQVYKDDTSFTYYTDKLRASFYRFVEGDEYTIWEKDTLEDVYDYYKEVTIYEYFNATRDSDTFKDKNIDLYKLVSLPEEATSEEKKSTEIEKFQYIKIFTFRPATQEEIASGEILYEKVGDQYIQHTKDVVEGQTYYTQSEEQVLVSLGTEAIEEDYSQTIYIYPSTKTYAIASQEDLDMYWDFETYPLKPNEDPSYGCPIVLFYQKPKTTYEPASAEELVNYTKESVFYYQANYKYLQNNEVKLIPETQDIFIVVPMDAYVPWSKFEPSEEYNYIEGKTEPNEVYPKDDPISIYTVSDFIPEKTEDTFLAYEDLILANIQIPLVATTNGLDLPFKYDYTVVPCMNYGRLDHLAVSNTVDFSKLHAFDQSNFTTWKYHIDGEQLRLTFGAEIYDTYEEYKVSGLLLEFYDLWGFAGSLEINNKKSYNGLFTKVLPLNTGNILSKKKLVGETTLTESFIRNININYNQNTGGFTFNDNPVVFSNEYTGWTGINQEDNDCGTLYSNILYTVKTYLRHEGSEGVKYLPKREFFLYTLPIFNDYYYNVSDFSTISSPPLDLVLTYKLQDSSSQLIYNQDGDSEKNTIVKGYYKQDSDLLGQYTSGYVGNNVTNINTVKYVNYTGQTNLYLEVGLKQEYQEFGLKYSPDINERFSCVINLAGNDEGQVYNVISNNSDDPTTDPKLLLNYYHGNNTPIDIAVNTLKFGTNNNSELKIDNLRSHNFLNPKDSVSIPIPVNYNFVVGYPIHVTNIGDTEIQALTICALCHQDDNGEYNYSDFGIYEQEDRYLSETMWYNGGTHAVERFGVCKMVNPDAQFMGQQCQSVDFVESEATYIKNAGKLNTGEPLKRMREYIGKLTFCQPHAHCLRETEGVNIHGDNSSPRHAIAPKHAVERGVTQGLLPWWYLYQNPRYNSCLHTKNTINSYGEFISTLQHSEFSSTKVFDKEWAKNDDDFISGNTKAKEYTGLTSLELEKYNSRLLQTMKKVYAYNPDYDSLKMKAGDASVVDNKINFISHIISKYAKITFIDHETLNDFIYFGNIKVADYIDFMWKHSAYEEKDRVKVYSDSNTKKPQEQITFIEKLDYCGGEDPYLVSTLTYNTPAPANLQSEWALKVSNPVVVRKENRECVIINGTPNKKALYGFDENSQKLVELDVSNYEIESTGNLKVLESVLSGSATGLININSSNFEKLFSPSGYNFTVDSGDMAGKRVELNISWDRNTTQRIPNTINDKLYLLNTSASTNPYITLTATAKIENDGEIEYTNASIFLKGKVVGKMLNSSVVSMYSSNSSNCRIGVMDQIQCIDPDKCTQTYLQGLVKDYPNYTNVSIPLLVPTCMDDSSYTGIRNITSSTCWVSGASNDHKVSVNSGDASFNTYNNNKYKIVVNVGNMSGLGLYEIAITQVTLLCDKRQKVNSIELDVVPSKKTTNYASYSKDTHLYTVLEKYKEARLRGTSITINDLEYDYKGSHRLFIKQSSTFEYDDYLRNRLYYRDTFGYSNTTQYEYATTNRDVVTNGCFVIRAPGDEEYGKNTPDFEYLNTLYFYTGPCFTKDNL